MAQANAHLKPKSKPNVSATSADAPYVSGEVAAGAASQRTEAQVRAGHPPKTKIETPASEALRNPGALPKCLQGKVPLDYVKAPVTDPDAYALIVTGNCMEPLIRDGDVAVCTPGSELRRGMIVGVHFKDGRMANIKRLLMRPSPVFFCGIDGAVESLCVEQTNPPKRLSCESTKVEAIHAVVGMVRAGKWISLEPQP